MDDCSDDSLIIYTICASICGLFALDREFYGLLTGISVPEKVICLDCIERRSGRGDHRTCCLVRCMVCSVFFLVGTRIVWSARMNHSRVLVGVIA